MEKERKGRLILLSLFVVFLFTLLIIHYFKIQVVDFRRWTQLAKQQHQTVIEIPSKRGVFYSDTSLQYGHPEKALAFVIDVPKYHLMIDPSIIPFRYKEPMMEKILSILTEIEDEDKFKAHFSKRSRSRKLASWLSKSKEEQIMQWWKPFAREHRITKNALFCIKEYKRCYPFGKLLGQVLHTLRDDRDEKTGEQIPTGGLELVFNKELKGVNGKQVYMRSPSYTFETDKVVEESKDGQDIHLTINHYIQEVVENELEKGVNKVHAKSGWAVLMDPFTGNIMALAHYPFFNPANYRDYYNDEKLQENVKIKAITDCFEPGSTMKPLTMVIALLANEELKKRGKRPIIAPSEMLRVDNGIFPGRGAPLKDVRHHKNLNMYHALQKSSNIYFARVIERVIAHLGVDWYKEQLERIFGFGMKTGIELPYENPGFLPDPGALYANGKLQWSLPTPYSLAIGYNLLTNSLQMVKAFALIANGGYDVNPTLIKNKWSAEKAKRLIPEDIVNVVTDGLKYVTKPGGSAVYADVGGYTVVGKTSTTEKLIEGKYSKKKHFSSFVGFCPAGRKTKDRPRFVLMVGIDEPKSRYIPGFGTTHYGGKSAAPVFKEIAKQVLDYLGVEEDDPYGWSKSDQRYDESKAVWMKEVKILDKLYKEYNK